MNVVTATKSNNTITVLVNDNGGIKQIPATSDHPKWAEILKAWTEQNHEALLELLSMKRIVEKFSNGGLVVSDNGVFFKDIPLMGIDVDRLMAFMRQGEPYKPIANYMVRKLANPSRRAINEMYNFLEHKNMPLTPEGKIIAYKGVLKDFFSVSSGQEPLKQGRRNEAGQIFNGVGETIEMSRSWVDDDFRKGCSGGLHAGSLEYAKNWARSHDGIIILIEIDPADVVSVPEDCNCTKLRCCRYKVIGVYDGPLPDTYVDDYSDLPEDNDETSCDNCGETECNCEDEICDNCGENVNDCTCREECECGCESGNCDGCDEVPDDCTCDADEKGQCGTCGCQDEQIPPHNGPISNEPPVCPCGKPAIHDLDVCRDCLIEPQTKETVREQLGLDEKGDEIRQKFVTVVCEQLGCKPEDVTDDQNFIENLGADSLDAVELVMALEEAFDVEIPDEVAESAITVGAAISKLKALLDNKGKLVGQEIPPTPVDPVKTDERNDQRIDSYQEGYEKGFRNGVRRRARMYRQGDENNVMLTDREKDYARGYNDGYRAGRKDYKH